MKALSFEGNGFEYFKIWIVNILLIIITLGLYYPWAKVRTKRYFYANTTLERRSFDYHATGKQLFIGYLIAMALFIAYAIVQQVSPTGGGILFLVLIIALPWIVWRSLKFSMRMTSFSNVRFGFDGELSGAYFNYLLLPILAFLAVYGIPVAIGVFFPSLFESVSVGVIGVVVAVSVLSIAIALFMYAFIKNKNASYVINASRYGQGRFSTELETSKLAMILFKTACLFILGLLAFLIMAAILSFALGLSDTLIALSANADDSEVMADAIGNGAFTVFGLVYIGFIAVGLLVFSYSFARQRAYIFSNSRLDNNISLASTLRARSLAWVSISNFLAIIFSLGLAIPWAKVRMARLVLTHTEVDTSLGFDDYVTQQQNEQSSLGEQIGDAFDVDVGLGF